MLLTQITMSSTSPHRSAESLKLGHTMTFAWHFCFPACFCSPCCLECLPFASIVMQIQPILQSSGQILSWWIQPRLILPISKPPLSCRLCHTIWQFLFQSSVFINHVLNCFICVSFTFSENLFPPHAFYFSEILMEFYVTSGHSKKSRITTWCPNLHECINVKGGLWSVLTEMEKYYWNYERKIRKRRT